MKKIIIMALVGLAAAEASATVLLTWDGSGAKAISNTISNVDGTLFGSADSARGSNDGWFGPDSVLLGGMSSASTADTVSYRTKTENNTSVGLQIRNPAGSGQDIELGTILFDYNAIWLTGPQDLEVYYSYGQLGDGSGGQLPNDTLLLTLNAAGNAGNGTNDYLDFSVDLQAALADFTLAPEENATFRIQGISASNATVYGLVDNIAINGTLAPVPEPSTFALLAGFIGLAGVLIRRKRR